MLVLGGWVVHQIQELVQAKANQNSKGKKKKGFLLDRVPGCTVSGAQPREGWKCNAEVAAHCSSMGLDRLSLLMNTRHQETRKSLIC